MVQVTEQVLSEMIQVILEAAHPEEIVLFGSRGRGQASGESDVDLLVVESEPFGKDRSRRQEMRKLYDALGRFRIPMDILVYSREEIEYWRDSLNHVAARALREGRVLYERP
jgi:predicted nucleotidyltransferase